MKTFSLRGIALLLLSAVGLCVQAQCTDVDLVVAQDGSGDYASIQAAIDAAPENESTPFRIFIKNGTYDEKLFFEKSYITLLGESRDSTIITQAILRRAWREENPSDWGAATVNIASNVTDLTFANLTIQNNFADVYPDYPNPNDHSFAIRGGGHRIILLNCNVTATGGDTLSLWNTNGGMFYHRSCYFEGYVDYIAPRGYCYISDSEFYGHNSTASIWHDGSGGEDHKLVISNSTFDGVRGFALGRHHRDAQFYLLDCFLTENMKNQKIYWEGRDEIQWASDRVYYYNTHRPVFDWSWHRDNLHEATGNPEPEVITAAWTFNHEWDPESDLDGLLPFAFIPSPANEACAGEQPVLSWAAARCATQHLIFLGESPDDLTMVASQDSTRFETTGLEENTRYYWRVDEVVDGDTILGPVWNFLTAQVTDFQPNASYAPFPANGTEYYTNLVELNWQFDDCTVDSSYFYLGESPDELILKGVEKYGRTYVAGLDDDVRYYWRVDTKNTTGITTGEVWSFVLNPTVSSTGTRGKVNFELEQNYPNPAHQTSQISYRIPSADEVKIELFDTQGRLLRTLVDERQAAGNHTLMINAVDLPGGLIYCRMRYQEGEKTMKIIVK